MKKKNDFIKVIGLLLAGIILGLLVKVPLIKDSKTVTGTAESSRTKAELTERFVNERFHYSFRHSKNMVIRNTDDKTIGLYLADESEDPFITFSIVAKGEDQKMLTDTYVGLQSISEIQRDLYETNLGGHASSLDAELSILRTANSEDTGLNTIALGFPGRAIYFVYLKNGQLLRIEGRNAYGWTETHSDEFSTILNTINPYL
ncbi:MAG: hypothetical protein A3C02_03545 [Candidatus Andersenbacteria bacterium RIFCSPHIGHO2_02_FULL_45_11]|uniref:Uncharacterized protein n=1 Tax=Candidatus Andersenbacteria bacterium RIFCSPHIGHO2_12_FULL_45_11 TaxID=1797281 RepID=A0A1G1X6Q3_9BACT|nr:MAG: hypothetical protein A2805_03490 [Candidatus Andersenbacteria bacterium RIFCSPHIGHO2_01_FULL_46_36]OGY32075.1 MAG: hypothetical protein A3C02_03545 [Candidatus Andersenbacteria bacterium RIFCSPHIGHO2_02_FULL_45_11]OGY35037.1 MAG: hypothetical protein A3D99_00655 [Candidatus Andersenbacteria bacterium RIFCSPHIGHO2_12_FULL_45_11]